MSQNSLPGFTRCSTVWVRVRVLMPEELRPGHCLAWAAAVGLARPDVPA